MSAMSAITQLICREIEASIACQQQVLKEMPEQIETAARWLFDCLKRGNKILLFGNGGSASDAQHLAGEFVGRFRLERQGVPALSLTADSATLTAIANDYGYDRVFARQIEALGAEGDVVLFLSSSGNSPNLLAAIEVSRQKNIRTMGLLGKDGGKAAPLVDLALIIRGETPHIQEAQMMIGHILCHLVEEMLFGKLKE